MREKEIMEFIKIPVTTRSMLFGAAPNQMSLPLETTAQSCTSTGTPDPKLILRRPKLLTRFGRVLHQAPTGP
jgi:hypothetical protein